jgi:hypothetical protein
MDPSQSWISRRRAFGLLPCGALFLAVACEHSATPTNPNAAAPSASGAAVFSAQASIGDLQHTLDSGAARVRIRLVRDSLVADRIVIERARKMSADEEVEGRVTAVATGPGADTLTLDVGGLKVVLDSATRLRGQHEWGDDDEHGARSGLAEFTMRLTMALGAGRRPFVEARRKPAAAPQAPGDGSFTAATIRLDAADEAPELEVNVDSANFSTNGSPPPDGWITVLGLAIEIRSTTTIKADLPRASGVMEFSDTVLSADVVAATVTLAGGTVLRIVVGSEIESAHGVGIASLALVAADLAAGKTVLAHGRGLLVTAPPRTFDVIEVVFHLGI